jgi:hypothetical protein
MPPLPLPARYIDGSPYKSAAVTVLADYLNARGPVCLTPQTFKALLDTAEAAFRIGLWHPMNGSRSPVEVSQLDLGACRDCHDLLKEVVPS